MVCGRLWFNWTNVLKASFREQNTNLRPERQNQSAKKAVKLPTILPYAQLFPDPPSH